MNKIINKKSLLVAAAALAACVSTSAGAAPAPDVRTTLVRVNITNSTGNCVRYYLGGRQVDVGPWARVSNVASPDHWYMASVFGGRTCGGRAIRSQWFQTGWYETYWKI